MQGRFAQYSVITSRHCFLGEFGDSEGIMAPNPESQGSEEAGDTEMEAVEAQTQYTMHPVQGDEEDEGELPVDFERLWKAANDNPQDFTSWTDLLQYCEQEVKYKISPCVFSSLVKSNSI